MSYPVDFACGRRALFPHGSRIWPPRRASGTLDSRECSIGTARCGDLLARVLVHRRGLESRLRGRHVLVRSPNHRVVTRATGLYHTKILEVLVLLDDGQELPLGLRVWTFIVGKT